MDVANVFYGPTQSGKSTTFNWLVGNMAQQVGDGSGESVTVDPVLQQSQIGLVVDTPGLDDSLHRFTNEEAGMKVAVAVVAEAAKVKVVVFESLASDSMRLRNTLAHLTASLGEGILKATVVLMTKADRMQGDGNLRVERIRQTCREFGIQEAVLWQNVGIDEAGRQQQLQKLREALARLQGIATKDIENLNTRIEQRAQQLCDDALPVKKTIQETYTEDELRDETFAEHYVEFVDKVTTKQVPVPYTVREQVNPVQQLFTLGAFGGGVDVHKTRIETLTSTEQVPVQKTRMVPKRVPRPVTKHRTKEIDVRLEVDHFVSEAREQVLAEARSHFAKRM